MKKHDEGYALVLVLVVMLVLCLVATSVLTIALNNLKKQETSVARMKAKYEAQGKIEKIYANLQYDIERCSIVNYTLDPELETKQYLAPLNRLGLIIRDGDGELIVNEEDVEILTRFKAGDNQSEEILGYDIIIKAYGEASTGEIVCVSCIVALNSAKMSITPDENGNFIVVDPVLSYSAYEVTVVTPEGGAGK